jgi:AmmeMemoRadiSam system protein A
MLSLSKQERIEILELARASLRESVCHNRQISAIPDHGVLGLRRGVFVSLHCNGKLRGCIGIVEPTEILGRSIARCAVSAAREDPRFAPLRPDEVEDVDIEISVLSPLAPIAADDAVIGEHGLLIEQGLRRGLLLPQVAVEHGLNREKFLQETCRKAGLAADAWKEHDTKIFGFTCEIIGPQP